jgi:hypothetical protein
MKRTIATSLIAAALMSVLGPHARADVAGQGVLRGTITWPSRLQPFSTCPVPPPSPFYEASTTTTLTVTDGSQVFAGSVTTQNVHGDLLCGGRFTVNSPEDPATFSGLDANGEAFSGSFYGSVATVGAVATVSLLVTGRISGGPEFTVAAYLDPLLILPTEGDPLSLTVRSGVLIGRFRTGTP